MRVTTLQIVAGLAIAAAGLVPVAHRNKPFWGVYAGSMDGSPPRIHQVDDDSPAKTAGLRPSDVVLSINGEPVDNSGMNATLTSLRPGDEARLRVQRGEAELDIVVRGVEPPIAMVYFPTAWHPVAGGLGLAMTLLVLATQPLRPGPLWRPSLVAVVGLGCGVVFFLAVAHNNPFAFWKLRQYHTLNWGERLHFEQTWVGLVASIVLAILAAWELRSLLAYRQCEQRQAEAGDSAVAGG